MSFVATIEADINKWTPNLDKAGKDVSNFANRAKQDLDKVSKAQRGAGTVAMEFNRVIQDAPFGMMGISNNLTQLSDNYKTYANNVRQAALEQGKSISNFQIFKGAVAGVLSPINLFSLGLSAVTSGIILYNQWKQKANKATKESTDKFKELNDSLSNLSTTMYKAAQQSGAEVAQLGTLYKVTQDVTQSTGARKKAAKDLIDQYPALFGKFSQEQVMLGKAKTAYDEVSKSIIATARAQAAYGRIGEKASQQLAIDETNRSLQKEIALLDVAIQRQESLTTAGKSAGAVSESVEAGNVARLNNLYSERADILKQVSGNLLDRAKLQEDINQLEGFASTNQANTIALTEKQAKANKDYRAELDNTLASFGIYEYQIKEITSRFDKFEENAIKAGASLKELGLIAAEEVKQKLDVLKTSMNTLFTDLTTGLKSYKLTGVSNTEITMPLRLNPVLADGKYETVTSDIGKKTTELVDRVNSTLSTGISSGLSSMFSSVGEALASGGNVMEAIGNQLVAGLGNLAKSIGEQMIQFGVAGIALKKLAMNPYLAVAAGAALVALGSMATSSIGQQTANYNGSTGSYGSSIDASNSVLPRGAYFNNDRQEVVLKLRNGDLEGAVKFGEKRNNRLG